MKTIFVASLCRKGIRGGALVMDERSVTYRTGAVTTEERYRKFRIGFEEIEDVALGRKFLFPMVTFRLKGRETVSFIVFGRRRFLDLLAIRTDRFLRSQK